MSLTDHSSDDTTNVYIAYISSGYYVYSILDRQSQADCVVGLLIAQRLRQKYATLFIRSVYQLSFLTAVSISYDPSDVPCDHSMYVCIECLSFLLMLVFFVQY